MPPNSKCGPTPATTGHERDIELVVTFFRSRTAPKPPPGFQRNMGPWAESLMRNAVNDPRFFESMIKGHITGAENFSRQADADLRFLARAFISAGQPIPEPLAGYISKILDNRGPKYTAGRRSNIIRDRRIVQAIFLLMKLRRYAPTRNETSDKDSACSIVAKALAKMGVHITEAAVTKVWTKRNRSDDLGEGELAILLSPGSVRPVIESYVGKNGI